jgi:hypothetical protein
LGARNEKDLGEIAWQFGKWMLITLAGTAALVGAFLLGPLEGNAH